MEVWRLCRAPYARFDGEGARESGGRWNKRGTRMVYTSATLSLAVLEYLVNHPDFITVPSDLIAVPATLPVGTRIESVKPEALLSRWREYPAPDSLAELGTAWALRRSSPVLAVPSAVVPRERNFLINPEHPDFRKIKVGKTQPFAFDSRLRRARPASALRDAQPFGRLRARP